MPVILLQPFDLILASVLVIAVACLSYVLSLDIEKRLMLAAARTTVQLLLIGLILKALFQNTSLLFVGCLSFFMLVIAGREVTARQHQRFKGWWGYGIGIIAMFLSSFTITILALNLVVGNDPWYDPRYAVPLLGMMLGNTMNGISLSIDRFTESALKQRASIEARLLLGAPWSKAIADLSRDAMRVGLIPITNAMAAAGIVSLPGMMTGQILAGTPPVEAVKYQILIMFMIASGTGFGVICAVKIGTKRLSDERERLRLDRLYKK